MTTATDQIKKGETATDYYFRLQKAKEPLMKKNPFKAGQKVRLKSDNRIYTVYDIYDDKNVSLALRGYPDTEQDYQTSISEIEPIRRVRK